MHQLEWAIRFSEQFAVWFGVLTLVWRTFWRYAPGGVLRMIGFVVAFTGGETGLSRADQKARGLQALGLWIGRAFGRITEDDWKKMKAGSAEQFEAFQKWSARKAARARITARAWAKAIGLMFWQIGVEIVEEIVEIGDWIKAHWPAWLGGRRRDVAARFARLQKIMGDDRPATLDVELRQLAEIESIPMRDWDSERWVKWASVQRILAAHGAPVDERKASAPDYTQARGVLGVVAAKALGVLSPKLAGYVLLGSVAANAALLGAWQWEKHAAGEARALAHAPCSLIETSEHAEQAREPCILLGQAQRANAALTVRLADQARETEAVREANNARIETKAGAAKTANADKTKRRLTNVARPKPPAPVAGVDPAFLPPDDFLRLNLLERPEDLGAAADRGGAASADPGSGPVP